MTNVPLLDRILPSTGMPLELVNTGAQKGK